MITALLLVRTAKGLADASTCTWYQALECCALRSGLLLTCVFTRVRPTIEWFWGWDAVEKQVQLPTRAPVSPGFY